MCWSRMTAQRITDVTATHTRVDVEANYFTRGLHEMWSLLRHQIREDRTVCTDGCRQTADFTSAGSFGIICMIKGVLSSWANRGQS